jgi:hypothetical protein
MSAFVAAEIGRVIRNELDDCERAIKNNDEKRALDELDDAIRKLKRIASQLDSQAA